MKKLENLGKVLKETKGTIVNGISSDGGKLVGYTVKSGQTCSTGTRIHDVYSLASKSIPEGELYCKS